MNGKCSGLLGTSIVSIRIPITIQVRHAKREQQMQANKVHIRVA